MKVKKIFNWSMVACAIFTGSVLLSSCDPDPVEQSVTFRINPSTVIRDLVPVEAGDLDALDSGRALKVDLYVYNSSGNLVYQDSKQFGDYTHVMNTSEFLEEGDYTAVAMTSIIYPEDKDLVFWEVEGTSKLSTFTVKDAGRIGLTSKILGLSVKKFKVEDTGLTVNVDVECVGALAVVGVFNWKGYEDIEYYGILTNKTSDGLNLDNQGNIDYSIESKNDYGWGISRYPYSANTSGYVQYVYMFPTNNQKMTFVYTADGYYDTIGQEVTMNIKKGHTYWFTCDVADNTTSWDDVTNADVRSEMKPIHIEGNLEFNDLEKSIRIAL